MEYKFHFVRRWILGDVLADNREKKVIRTKTVYEFAREPTGPPGTKKAVVGEYTLRKQFKEDLGKIETSLEFRVFWNYFPLIVITLVCYGGSSKDTDFQTIYMDQKRMNDRVFTKKLWRKLTNKDDGFVAYFTIRMVQLANSNGTSVFPSKTSLQNFMELKELSGICLI